MVESLGRRTVVAAAVVFWVAGCASHRPLAELTRDNQALREEAQRLQHELERCDNEIAAVKLQMTEVTQLGPERPADLFAPTAIEIASLSGGANYDDKPGDDGVTVHLRPKDADGQVVKVPGRIRVQLLDNSDMSSPKVVAVCEHQDPEELRKLWMGIFGTNHYTIRCPFPEGARLPESRKLLVSVAFTDFLTGKTLTTSQEVQFSPAGTPD